MAFKTRMFAAALCLLGASARPMTAQEPLQYREFVLGSNLATVAKVIGAPAMWAKVVHERPALLQNLEWRPRNYSTTGSTANDPVELIVFKFYNDQLFAIVADYDGRRTEGMSPADMIAAISATYGDVSQVPSRLIGTRTRQYGYPDTSLAVWGDAASSVTLFRVGGSDSFRLVVSETELEALARTATAVAVRLDGEEAPDREIARQKSEADAALAAQEKAKTENKAQFRP